MKISVFKFSIVILFGLCVLGFANDAKAQNAINGIVFDENRKPLANAEVELLDSFERLIRSQKTRGAGFYTFQSLRQGIYYIKVRVGGTNYRDKKLRIDLGDLNSIGGVDVKQVDVFMEIDSKRKNSASTKTGVVFAQEIPREAKKSYDSGLKNVKKKKLSAAEKDFVKAIQIFPYYFEALSSLGELHLKKNDYAKAENALQKASEINEKSFETFFNLATAQNSQKKFNDAVKSLTKSIEIDNGAINSHLLLGIIQRKLKQYSSAEKSLLRAKKLGNNAQPDVNWQLAELYYFNLKNLPAAAEELKFYLKNLTKVEKRKNPQKIAMVKKLIKQISSEATSKS